MILMFLLRGPPALPEPHESPGSPGYNQDGLQLHHLLVVEKEWEQEKPVQEQLA